MASIDANGVPSGRGDSTKWEVVHDGKRYPPKAVVHVAYQLATGRPPPQFFAGDHTPGNANSILTNLGFLVVEKGQAFVTIDRPERGATWSEREVQLTVDVYFEMLRRELLGQKYIKSQLNKMLREELGDRSHQAVEYKHANISAVLIRLGLPYVRGYQPRSNIQNLLRHQVEKYLDATPEFFDLLERSPTLHPTHVPVVEVTAFDAPPDAIVIPNRETRPWGSRRGRRIDYAEREARNRQIGELGERWVVKFEQRRLLDTGRDDLADKVEWISDTCGDGTGFDVLSFDEGDGRERLVEVKTTSQGKHFPFYLTRNEVKCSEDCSDRFYLYRVFDFSSRARVFNVRGSLAQALDLEPIQYRASIGGRG